MNDLISRSAFDEVLDEFEGLKAHAAFTEGIMVARRELALAPAVDAAPKWHDARKEPPEEYTEGLLVIVSGQPLPNVEFKNALQLASYAPGEGWIVEGWAEWEDPDVSWWQIPQLPEGIEEINK